MKILVTGGAGFIGSTLIRKLLEQRLATRIISVDDYSSGDKKNHVDSERVKYVRSHTSEIESFIGHDNGLDLIFHFGEYSRIATSFEDQHIVWKSNLFGTACVLNAWLRTGAKLIYSGSSSIFADPNLSPYAFTKKTNVDLIKNFSSWYNLDYRITYFYNVYGPGQISSGRMATIIGIFQRQYLASEPLTVVRPGTQRRDLTHVDDVTDGVIKAALYEGGTKEFQLCTGHSYSVEEIANAFTSNWEYVDERPGERFDSFGKNDDARELLGWHPAYDVIQYILDWKRGIEK